MGRDRTEAKTGQQKRMTTKVKRKKKSQSQVREEIKTLEKTVNNDNKTGGAQKAPPDQGRGGPAATKEGPRAPRCARVQKNCGEPQGRSGKHKAGTREGAGAPHTQSSHEGSRAARHKHRIGFLLHGRCSQTEISGFLCLCACPPFPARRREHRAVTGVRCGESVYAFVSLSPCNSLE